MTAAILAATAGSSYAKLHRGPHCRDVDSCTQDVLVVGNNGAILGSSYEVFSKGAKKNTAPLHEVKGAAAALHSPAGVALSTDGQTILIANQQGANVLVFGSGSNGNTAPSAAIGGANTGLENPAGVAFLPGNTFAVADTLGAVTEPPPPVTPPAPTGICATPFAVSLGIISEFTVGDNGNVTPLNNSPVNASTTPRNATIGGCDTFLFGPTGIAADATGKLWVANSLGGIITSYEAGASGDAIPDNIIFGATEPVFVAIGEAGTEVYVTDLADNTIKIFDTSTVGGTLIATVGGGGTKLFGPMGIASSGTNIYVANNSRNSLLMFDNSTSELETGGSVRPNVIVRGSRTNLLLPTGLAVAQTPESD